jgi:hypothetical protein
LPFPAWRASPCSNTPIPSRRRLARSLPALAMEQLLEQLGQIRQFTLLYPPPGE